MNMNWNNSVRISVSNYADRAWGLRRLVVVLIPLSCRRAAGVCGAYLPGHQGHDSAVWASREARTAPANQHLFLWSR